MTAPWRFKVYSGKGLEFLGKKQAEIYKKVSLKEGDLIFYDKRAGYSMIIKDDVFTIIQEKDVVVVV